MAEHSSLAHQFEQSRGHLRAIAFRMLGSSTEADDAVQESWLRLSRSDVSSVDNLTGWLTTVVARVCLDMPAKHACARRSHDRGMAKHHVWNPQSSYLQQPQFVVMNSVLNASANVEVR